MNPTTRPEATNEPDPRVSFAAERTLLAWVRTGLAMMGFGFVVARFGLFLRELEPSRGIVSPTHFRASEWVGVALILLGVLVNVLAPIRHYRFMQRLNQGETLRFRALSIEVVLSAVLAALGLGLAAYLVLLR